VNRSGSARPQRRKKTTAHALPAQMSPFWNLRDFELSELLELEAATRRLVERLTSAPAAERHPEVADILSGSLREYGDEIERRTELPWQMLG
jgi:hypothetical protein